MIKLVAFDWNGTLFADAQACLNACNHFFKALDLKPITLAQFRRTFTVPVIDFYEKNVAPRAKVLANSKLNAEIFHTYYELLEDKIRSRAHAKEVLAQIYRSKIDCIVISNHMVPQIRKQLKRLDLDKFVKEVLANTNRDAPMLGNTKAERIETYLKKYKIKGEEILIVGDGLEEIEIAKTIGAISVAVTHGYWSTSRLKAAKPDYLINSLKEVIRIVKRIN